MKIRIVEFHGSNIACSIEHELSSVFSAEMELIPSPFPELSEIGEQYDARELLRNLVRLHSEKDDVVIGITSSDLMLPGFNFVFGLAERKTSVAVISTCRLQSDYSEKFQERCLKEAIHEIGHLLSLNHCDDPLCVMHFSNSLLDTDMKSAKFCRECSQLLL